MRQRGESLLEVIIAVSILATIMVSVFSLLIRGASTNVNVTNRVVAINVAREGMEAVRNIRDTNWLKYSGDRRAKWLCLDSEGNDACEGNLKSLIEPNNYTVDFSQIDKRYYLARQLETVLSDKDTLPANENYRLYLGADGRFTHTAGGDVTKYYRQVYLRPETGWLDTAGCSVDGCPTQERMQVSVRVQWQEDKAIRHLDMETYLYDFFGRDEY